jgi:amino acid permease
VSCYGCLCSYVVAIGGLSSNLLGAWTGGDGGVYTSQAALSLAVGVLLLPFCLVGSSAVHRAFICRTRSFGAHTRKCFADAIVRHL